MSNLVLQGIKKHKQYNYGWHKWFEHSLFGVCSVWLFTFAKIYLHSTKPLHWEQKIQDFNPGILHNPGAGLGYEEFLPDLNKKKDIVFIIKASMTFQCILKNEKLSNSFIIVWRQNSIEEAPISNPGRSPVPPFPDPTQIQPAVARSNLQLPDPTCGCQIQPEVARSNLRLPDPTCGCQIQPEVARFNRRLPDLTCGFQIQPEVARSNRRLPNSSCGCQIQPEVARSNQRLPDSTCQIQPRRFCQERYPTDKNLIQHSHG